MLCIFTSVFLDILVPSKYAFLKLGAINLIKCSNLGLKMYFPNEISLAGRSSYEFHWAKHVNSHYPCQGMCRIARVCFRPWRRRDNMLCPNDSYLTSMHNDLSTKLVLQELGHSWIWTRTSWVFQKEALSKWRMTIWITIQEFIQNPLKMLRV